MLAGAGAGAASTICTPSCGSADVCIIGFAAEKNAAANGTERLVLLTTRTADWFEQRGFAPAGAAHESELLPDSRRAKVRAASFHLCRGNDSVALMYISIRALLSVCGWPVSAYAVCCAH